MRIAVLGVGLIGGSIGLAARARMGARIAGYDRDPATLDQALELGAVDEVAETVADAVRDASIIFCAAPVRVLPDLVAEALAASDDEAVVADAGSTKLGLLGAVSGLPGAERFIGGHPLAGAETAGVRNARADLFEGARWFLTPGPDSLGLHYDLLQRTVAGLGARPQAIDADLHDRTMATISHVPHVIANVLVTRARSALAAEGEGERLPEVGPSFRDTTRVAGANPAIWGDIFVANADAVADEIDAVIERLRASADVIRRRDPGAVGAWHREALEARRALLETDLAGGELRELRVGVENRPGTVAEIALALGHAGVNIEDMGLYPATDMRTGAISLWIAGDEEAERAVGVVRELGHSATIVSDSP